MNHRSPQSLRTFAQQLHGWGANVTAIKPGTKRPAHYWEQWQTEHQTREELEGLPWQTASAAGVVNGSGNFRFFDLDAVKDANGQPAAGVPESVLIELLAALSLPDDYQWSYASGSGAGWGVVVRCEEALPNDWQAEKGVYIGLPRDGRAFGQLELRWSSGQTVIDGAHPSGPGYRWRLSERPFRPPALLSAERVTAAFLSIATLKGHDTPARPRATVDHNNRYGVGALANAIARVSTAQPGDRNNALYRETAGLVELVNGGVLARTDVENAMAAAAASAGLPAAEAETTIASAFGRVKGSRRTPPPHHGNGSSAPDGTMTVGAFKLDDTGNAERFTAQHGHSVRYNHSIKKWYVWSGTHWKQDVDGEVSRLAKQIARNIYEEVAAAAAIGNDALAADLSKWAKASGHEARRNAMLNLARAERPIAATQGLFDQHAHLLNLANGTFNFDTCTLQPHSRDDHLTYVLPVHYDPDAACPLWEAFIDRITNRDNDLAAFLSRAVGYSLSGSTAEQCLFFLYGNGANGKSTFMELLMALMGDLAHKARAQVIMVSDRQNVLSEVAALAGKRLVVTSEMADGGRLDEALIKDMTGSDTMSARHLYGEPFNFRPQFKLWLYGNHKPVIIGTDEGIWRRIKLIPFTAVIPDSERDPNLPAKLREEMDGIMAWAIRGWQQYMQGGLGTPQVVQDATAAFRQESDTIGQFLNDRCLIESRLTAQAGELHASYCQWAQLNGLHPISNVRFAQSLNKRGFFQTRGRRGYFEYHGLGIRAEA